MWLFYFFIAIVLIFTDGYGREKNKNMPDKEISKCVNDDIEACKELCKNKNLAIPCFLAGYAYYYGEGIEQDYLKAKEYYEKACNNIPSISVACYSLGDIYYFGQGVEQDYFEAKKYYEKACNNKEAGACFNLGVMYNNGQGVKQDYFKAVELYRKACNGGDAFGCYNLGVKYYNGEGVRYDLNKAKEYFGKACDLKLQQGCDIYRELNIKRIK